MALRDYIAPLLKWWWLLVLSTALAVGSSYLSTRQQSPIYTARATVMVGQAMTDPNPNNSDLQLTQQLARTYTDIARRTPVRQATQEALGLTRLPEYRVSNILNTQLIEIVTVDTNPVRAQAVANELANQLIKQTPEGQDTEEQQRQSFINEQLNELEVTIQQTEREVANKQVALAAAIGAREITNLQGEIDALQRKLSDLRLNFGTLLASTQNGAINTIHIVEEASLPLQPVGPNKEFTILIAGAVGLLLAVGASYVLEHLDDRLKNPKLVHESLNLATLGAVPVAEEMEVRLWDDEAKTHSSLMEAFRILRTNLQFTMVDVSQRSLLVTSTSPSEGKSMVAANLAVSLALGGKQVAVVDADLHRPRVHKIFKIDNKAGLTTALTTEGLGVTDHWQPSSVPGLYLLPSGPLPPNPAELLSNGRMNRLVEELLTHVDFVIVDSPPAAVLADATILSTQLGGVLFIVDAQRTRREMAKRAVTALRQVNASIIGVLLNRMPTRQSDYYYYYYYENYYGYDSGGPGSDNLSTRVGNSLKERIGNTRAGRRAPGNQVHDPL